MSDTAKIKRILAVDPGTEKTAWVVMDGDTKQIIDHGITQNASMFDVLNKAQGSPDVGHHGVTHMAIEMMASMGMAVGQSVFETAVWIGRFIQEWITYGNTYELVYRADEKLHLCGHPRAKDSNIRQAIMDSYGHDPVGNKRNPGPLYGISKDEWSAIAVAKVAMETDLETRVNKRSQL